MGIIRPTRRAILSFYLIGFWLLIAASAGTVQPQFNVSVTPASLTIQQGNQATSTVTTTITGGFNKPVTFTASGVPAGANVSFMPQTIPAPGVGKSVMSVIVPRTVAPGNYRITVTGSGGGIQKSATVNLTVIAAPSFTLSASPASLTIQQGSRGSSVISTAISGGFNQAILLSASGAPAGTSLSFVPQMILAPGAGRSTMTISLPRTVAVGNYRVTVTGSGGGLQQTTTVSLTVTPAPSFTLAAAAASVNIPQGTQKSVIVATTIIGGFNQPVGLSASQTPTGVTLSFSPQTIPAPGAGKSTLTVTVSSAAPLGTYPVTITGSGGGVQQTTTMTLVVSGTPSFTLSVSPGSLSIQQGNQGSSTATTAISGGFNSTITLSASGTPAGVIVSFHPTAISAPGAGASTLTLAVGSSTPTGSYPIMVAANGGGIQHTATVTLTVTGTPKGQPPGKAYFMQPYAYRLQASFGTPPYRYQLASGSLPPGLILDQQGNLTGKPSAVGQFSFGVLVTDSSKPPQQQVINVALSVAIGLDSYGGFTAVPLPDCKATGYFRLMAADDHWIFADPSCNAFSYLGVQNAIFTFYGDGNYSGLMQARYGNNYQPPWMLHTKQRLQAWGFSAVGDYAYEPLYTDAQNSRMPYIILVKPTGGSVYGATKSPQFCSVNGHQYSAPIKSLIAGLPPNLQSYNDGHITQDTFDPMWGDCVSWTLSYTQGVLGANFNTSPWMIGITHEDMDDFRDFRGGAEAGSPYLNLAYVIAVTSPVGSGGTDTALWSKYAWSCGTINGAPVDFGLGWGAGKSFLEHEYGTIAALNAAWGSNYTSFCSAGGGWGHGGTGVLDEDDRAAHQAWMGSDPVGLSGANANVAADVNAFLYWYVYATTKTMVQGFRTFDANHMMFAYNFVGNSWTQTLRPEVLRAIRDAGVSAIHASYDPSQSKGGKSPDYFMQSAYAQTGLPVITWYALSANNDAYWHDRCKNGDYYGPGGGPCPSEADSDYPTQQTRGFHYANDLNAIFNARGNDGKYFAVGMNFWGWSDDTKNEHSNYGLVSNYDNAYDGTCAAVAPSTDAWGVACGGETSNYGPFLDSVTDANSSTMQQLIQQLLQ